MIHARGTFRVVKRIAIALIILGIVMSAISCGKKGNVYGSMTWDYSLYIYSLGGGWPSTIYKGVPYQVQEGTFPFYYYNYYYVGSTLYYYSTVYGTYTVVAQGGGLFSDGGDNNFQLYASIYGLIKSGTGVSSIVLPTIGSAPVTNTQTWTEGGLRITVTNKIVKMTPEEIAQFKSQNNPPYQAITK
jgi:hypothetical protein